MNMKYESIEQVQAKFNEMGNAMARMLLSSIIMAAGGDMAKARAEVAEATEAFRRDMEKALLAMIGDLEAHPELLAKIKEAIEKEQQA